MHIFNAFLTEGVDAHGSPLDCKHKYNTDRRRLCWGDVCLFTQTENRFASFHLSVQPHGKALFLGQKCLHSVAIYTLSPVLSRAVRLG